MSELLDFLRARLDEDEQTALAVLGVNALAAMRNGKPAPRWELAEGTSSIQSADGILRVRHTWAREAEHIVRWDPARVLAEVEAKREILDEYRLWADDDSRDYDQSRTAVDRSAALEVVVKLIAQLYADHPDYRDEWQP